MITMGVNWPMDEDDIRLFAMQQLDEFGISLVGDLCAAIDWPAKRGLAFMVLQAFSASAERILAASS